VDWSELATVQVQVQIHPGAITNKQIIM